MYYIYVSANSIIKFRLISDRKVRLQFSIIKSKCIWESTVRRDYVWQTNSIYIFIWLVAKRKCTFYSYSFALSLLAVCRRTIRSVHYTRTHSLTLTYTCERARARPTFVGYIFPILWEQLNSTLLLFICISGVLRKCSVAMAHQQQTYEQVELGIQIHGSQKGSKWSCLESPKNLCAATASSLLRSWWHSACLAINALHFLNLICDGRFNALLCIMNVCVCEF